MNSSVIIPPFEKQSIVRLKKETLEGFMGRQVTKQAIHKREKGRQKFSLFREKVG